MKRNPVKGTTMNRVREWLIVAIIILFVDSASAIEFEKLGTAVINVLGTKQAIQKKVTVGKEDFTTFYAKTKPSTLAVIQKETYPPNCTHTWVVGVNLRSFKVEKIRTVEMSCNHAFPCKEKSFLSQFIGMGQDKIKDLKDHKIQTIAKATGSSELAADAVRKSIEVTLKLRKKS